MPQETPQGEAVYTHGHHESVLRSHRWRTARNSAGYLLAHLRPDSRVLDLGCGPGTITADLARLVPRGGVVAVDSSPEVVEQARRLCAQQGLDNVEFTVGDATALNAPDDSFDVTHAHQVLQHLREPVRALREMGRVTRPGGLVAARDSDYSAMAWFPLVPGLEDWRQLYLRVARGNGGEPDAGRRLLSWARQAGLTTVTAGSSTWCFATPAEREWWSDLWAERTTSSALARTALERGYADEGELAALARAWREWGVRPDGWFSVPHGEILARM
ncbi:methyltransferase domain-containing protein [Streptomyces sp. NPDC005438]|uniref:methyltransferase domain-containing protein n=1 Tax=Streptomyces sp. NPDC005438 TaxID=3156880 RepID=UPI0033A993F9